MAPSYRDSQNRGLEDYICTERKPNGVLYYSYKLPNGKKKSIKRPMGASDATYKMHVNQMARKITHSLGRNETEADPREVLSGYLMAADGMDQKKGSITEILKLFKSEFLPQRRHAKSTLEEKHRLVQQYEALWGDSTIYEIGLRKLSDRLNTLTNASYIKHRGFWIDVFRYSISKGFNVENQAEKTLPKTQARTVRKRLKQEWFELIHNSAPAHLQRVMDFALLTLQRRTDLIEIMKSDIYPANLLPDYEIHFNQTKAGAEEVVFELLGYYWTHPTTDERKLVSKGSARKACDAANDLNRQHGLSGPRQLVVIQNKTIKHGDKACIVISLDSAMEEVIARCMGSELPSPNLLHFKPRRISHSKHKHWTAFNPDHVSKQFATIRDSLEVFQAMKIGDRPTFHEIRALGGKRYEDQYGKDKGKQIANMLMGHTSSKMTDHYLDGHRVEFTRAGTGE
jgi:hypothetical protein